MTGKDSTKIRTMIKHVVETCNVCKRFKKTPPRPRVALPKAHTTNEVISVDLKEKRDLKKYILYICDEFSGYMMAEVIKDKHPETVIKALNKRWVRDGPGIPSRGIFADNGGEFKNPEMKEVASKYGISLRLTAAHSPWSNGKNERNHYTCDVTIDKLMEEDPKISLDDAVSHAVNAKNMQINKTGFSPRQLTFGKQGVIPGISDGNPATMEMVTESDSFRNEFVNRQKSEELFRKIDANERIQKTLAQNTYGYADRRYSEGDLILFKENDKGRWSGPAHVTGMEGSKVQIIHAGYDRTVPACRVLPYGDDKSINDEEAEYSIDTVDDTAPAVTVGVANDEDETNAEKDTTIEVTPITNQSEDEPNREIRPKLRSRIVFKLTQKDNWTMGKVVSVGKKNGKDKFRCWIKTKDVEESFDFVKDIFCWKYCTVDFEKDTKEPGDTSNVITEVLHTGVWFLKHKDLENIEENVDTKEVFVTNIPAKYHDHKDVIEAKEKELDKWDKYEAYEEVDLEDQFVLGSRWVVQEKGDGVKARFVVKGCHERGSPRSDSPTASKDSLKLFLSITANEGFKMKSLDVTSAFLQRYPLVFIKPPKEKSKPGKVWKLLKSCYGLNDASRRWYMAVKETLSNLGMQSVSGDDAFFFYIKDGKLIGLCILHVDDFLISGNYTFHNIIEEKLVGRFTFGKIELGNFRFTGLDIKQTDEGIFVDQNEYIQSLEPIKIDKLVEPNEKLSKKKFAEYRALTGQLNWAAENTRPDLAFDARELSTKNKDANYGDLKNANKVLKKAQLEKDVTLRYPKLGNIEELSIVAYTDSSYRNSENKEKSVGGRFIGLANKSGVCAPLVWKSKTIQQVCKSVKTAETRSLERGMEDSIYLARMVQEIYSGIVSENQIPVHMKVDSQTLVDSLNSTKQVDEKTIRHLIAWIKQQKDEKTVDSIKWVCSQEQLADVFTKKNVKTEAILTVVSEGNLLLDLISNT